MEECVPGTEEVQGSKPHTRLGSCFVLRSGHVSSYLSSAPELEVIRTRVGGFDGTTCRLIDFEDGGLSDAAYELADHVEHIAGRLSGVVDGEALVAAVGLAPDERERMQPYRMLFAAFWLAMLLPENPGFHRNPPGTTEMQATHLMSLLP